MIRARVWGGRLDSPLFSVKQYARDLEDLFYKMFDKFKRGEKLTHIVSWGLSSSPAALTNKDGKDAGGRWDCDNSKIVNRFRRTNNLYIRNSEDEKIGI